MGQGPGIWQKALFKNSVLRKVLVINDIKQLIPPFFGGINVSIWLIVSQFRTTGVADAQVAS